MASRVISTPHPEGFWDSLDGSHLKNGDRLYVRWPSGSLQQVVVQLDSVPIGTLKDGEVHEIRYGRAYFLVSSFGSGAKIYLSGWEAQRIR